MSQPYSIENWRRWSVEHTNWSTVEYPVFTDCHVTGEIRNVLGPYTVLNAVPLTLGRELAPALVLRVDYPPPSRQRYQMEKTDDTRYHGGSLVDELCALISLCMGARMKPGKSIRTFDRGGDPMGRPEAFETIPSFSPAPFRAPVLPDATGTHSLEAALQCRTLTQLPDEGAVALIRAARLYQDSLWISESQTSLAWIMLVSALETAANYWRATEESPVERMHTSQPKLAKLLRDAGGDDHLTVVAELMAPYMGATKKFIDFSISFLPEAPAERGPEYARIDWSKASLKKALAMIYKYRSKALHGGTPFPVPMLMPPHAEGHKHAERPIGLATHSQGGTWLAKDAPMLFRTFEYIARSVLLKWWDSMVVRHS